MTSIPADRSELIDILHQTATADRVKNTHLRHVPVVAAKVEETADAILAAGYRKARIITKANELDALRFQAVVLDAYGTPYVCERHRTDGTRNEWRAAGMNTLDYSEDIAYHGPITVVHEGEPRP